MDTGTIQKQIQTFLEYAGFTVDTITLTEKKNTLWCDISTKDENYFLAHNAELLGAVNHLIMRMMESNENTINIIIDVGSHEKKRHEAIESTAHMMAERARFYKSSIKMDPMSAYERRVVHTFLEHAPDLITSSEGEGRDRCVVIEYTA